MVHHLRPHGPPPLHWLLQRLLVAKKLIPELPGLRVPWLLPLLFPGGSKAAAAPSARRRQRLRRPHAQRELPKSECGGRSGSCERRGAVSHVARRTWEAAQTPRLPVVLWSLNPVLWSSGGGPVGHQPTKPTKPKISQALNHPQAEANLTGPKFTCLPSIPPQVPTKNGHFQMVLFAGLSLGLALELQLLAERHTSQLRGSLALVARSFSRWSS